MREHLGVDPFREGSDLHLLVIDRQGEARACCSLWWTDTPLMEEETLGCIGHFYAEDEESGRLALAEARSQLACRGRTLALGPLNGNTWRKYRFVTEAGDEPTFALEPSHPGWWPSLWQRCGFAALAGYHSSLIDDLSDEDPRTERAAERLTSNGIRIRNLHMSDFEDDLSRIFAVSKESFARNFLYSPISEKAFVEMYRPFRSLVDPRFTLIAEADDHPVGFVFSLPDLAHSGRGEEGDTLVIKTLAALPGRAQAGLGAVLVDRMRNAARESGYKRIIHALMHDSNVSSNIGRSSRIIRRYTLFAQRLNPHT